MSDETREPTIEELREQARALNIEFHHATGAKKLQELIEAAQADPEPDNSEEPTADADAAPEAEPASTTENAAPEPEPTPEPEPEPEPEPAPTPKPKAPKPELKPFTPEQKAAQRAARKRKEAQELVRVRITNMNPNKKDFPGEFLSVSNRMIGTIRKYIPYNSDVPYHIPKVLYNELRERQCQVFVQRKIAGGRTTQESKLIKEFAIELLPNLTQEEIDNLAKVQAAKGNID